MFMNPRKNPAKAVFAALASMLLLAAHAAAPASPIPAGTVVRMEAAGVEGGWHEGRITVDSAGCTMVTLAKPTREGYTMIGLVLTTRLQRQVSGAWQDVPLKDFIAAQPKACFDGNG